MKPGVPLNPPTIRDVAELASVSLATVSNVLNGRAGSFSDGTRRRVERAVAQLSYRPHTAGRELRTASRQTLALIVIDEADGYLLDPFLANVVVGFSRECNARGYLAVLHGCRHRDLADSLIMRQLRVDGFALLMSGSAPERAKSLSYVAQRGRPIIVIQQRVAADSADVAAVRQDDYDGGRQLCEHLIARGVRRLALLMPELEWPALTERARGIREAASKARTAISIDSLVAASEGFDDVTRTVAAYLAKNPVPNAIVAINDAMALAVLNVLARRGLKVPDDLFVVGFNGFEASRWPAATLTTVASPAQELGRAAVECLVERLRGGRFLERDRVLPVRLQPGETT